MNPLFRLPYLMLAAACLLPGQSNANKGEIAGGVFDPGKAAVAGAAIEIRNASTGLSRHLTTDRRGGYRAVLLDAGLYTLTASASGFAPSDVEQIPVTVGGSIRIDVTLALQTSSTSIEAGASLINATLPAPTALLSASAITDLPINGRRFHDFAQLTPAVQADPQRGQLSIAGQRGINSNVMLDGADYNQPYYGGIRGGERSNSIMTVPQSAIEEFQVIVAGYSAEYGRSTGGVLNAITKSGSNMFHGDGFYQLRHKEFGARDPVQNASSLETLHQAGGSFGGPLRRDSLFFFAAAEAQRSRTPRQTLFAQLIGRTPPAGAQEAFDFYHSLERPFTQTNNAMAATVKADYQSVRGHRLTLRYNGSGANAQNAVSAGGAITPFTNRALSNDGAEQDRTHTGALQYTRPFSPTLLNDLRFTGSHELRPRLSNSATPHVTNTLGTFGARNFLPAIQDDMRWQLTDALSLTHGRHTLKFGIDYNRVTAAQSSGLNQYGGFSFTTSDINTILDILSPGGAIANRFDSTAVTYSRQLGNLHARMGMHQAAAFAKDNWRPANKLTLDFGLRWEGQFNPVAEANNEALASQVRGFVFPNGQTIDPGNIRDSPAQFMPRLGAAWSPFSGWPRTVIRAHTGLFYASTPLIVMAGPVNNFRLPPGDVSITLAPVGGLTVYQQLLAAGVDLNRYALGQIPVIPAETVQRAAQLALGSAPDPFAGASLTAMAADFRNPRAVQAGAGIESEILSNLVIGIQWNYVNTVHLQRNRDYNLPLPTLLANDASQRPNYGLRTRNVRRPLPNLGTILARESSARSLYRGATVSAQYRTRRYQFSVNYTRSRNFSDDDTERDAAGVNYADPQDFSQEYAYSRLDTRHMANAHFVLPLWLGFEAAGIVRMRSGSPITAITGSDNNEEFNTNDRPYLAPGVPMPRSSFRNRTVYFNDLRVLKRISLGETKTIQVSAEFFNLLNLDNVVYAGVNGGIVSGIYGPGFQSNGTVAAIDPRFQRLKLADGTYDRNNAQTGTPLQVQLGLRFYF